MARYAANGLATASATKAILGWNATATLPRRGKLYDLLLGSEAAPADNAFGWDVFLTTTSGVGTAIIPRPLDVADAASVFAAYSSYSTSTSQCSVSFLHIALNQRASFRWVAAPGSELVFPAVTANGHNVCTTIATAGVNVNAAALIEEQ